MPLRHPYRILREEHTLAEATDPFAGVNIDPATWEDPKQSFPGEIVITEFRMASDKYRAKTEFRPAITEELPQWDLRVKRLDATRQMLDGSYEDSFYYGGFDLKKWNVRVNDGAGGLVPLSSRYPKEWFITTAYKNVFGTVHPPTVLLGKKAMFDFYPAKAFGTVTARRVLVPASILAPDFEFTGEKVIFKEREKEDGDATEGTDAAVSSNGAVELLSHEAAMELIPALVVGLKAGDVAGIIEKLPQNLRLPEILTEIATQDLWARFDGKLTVNTEGVLSAV